MSLPIPQVRIEIFPQPDFADDNFVNGWTKISGGSSAFSSDGDLATIQSGDQNSGRIEKTFPTALSSDTYPRLQVRISSVDGTWSIALNDGAAWSDVASGTNAGVYDVALPLGKSYTQIAMKVAASGKTVVFDYVFISKNVMLVPTDELVEDNSITLPLLESGVSGADLNIPNIAGAYNGKINKFDRIIIYLWRLGDSVKKVFGGIITEITYNGSPKDNEFYVNVKCMGLGQQLQNPESLLQKIYTGTNGKTIILDAVALCSGLTNMFVDVDGDLASPHDIVFDQVMPYSVITKICKDAETFNGVVGFDAYVDPAGNVHVFARTKYVSTVDVTGKVIDYDHLLDGHGIKNKLVVYGKQSKFCPTSGDDWTEGTSGWTVVNGVLQSEGTTVKVGSYALKLFTNSGVADAYYMFPKIFCGDEYRQSFNKLLVWIAVTDPSDTSQIEVRLLSPDRSNYFSEIIAPSKLQPLDGIWSQVSLDLGLKEADWIKVGSPDWLNVQGIEFLSTPVGGGFGTFWFDGLHFEGAHFSGVSFDALSIAKYGTRWAEPQDDESLMSDVECDLKARSLVELMKEAAETFTLTVDGDNTFVCGTMQRVAISNDGLDAFFRILEITHQLRGVDWATALTLSNEPLQLDYVQALVSPPRSAGCTAKVPDDFGSLAEAVNAIS